MAYGLYAARTQSGQGERALLGRHTTAVEALDALLLVDEFRVVSTRRWSWEGQPLTNLAYEVCARRTIEPVAGAALARIQDDTLTVTRSFQMALPRRNLRISIDLFLAHMHAITGVTPHRAPRLHVVVTDSGHLSAKGV